MTFIDGLSIYNYKVGDFMLFQEYRRKGESYEVSKPILAIFLGSFAADQTLGFNYVQWVNENRYRLVSNEYFTNDKFYNQVGEIKQHVEWVDYIDLLGCWDRRPGWKELLHAYRKANRAEIESVPV